MLLNQLLMQSSAGNFGNYMMNSGAGQNPNLAASLLGAGSLGAGGLPSGFGGLGGAGMQNPAQIQELLRSLGQQGMNMPGFGKLGNGGGLPK